MSGHDELTDRTADLIMLSDVKRWTVIRTMRPQSVAEHSFNVAIIAMELIERLRLEPESPKSISEKLMIVWWALIHDAPELFTGDINGKLKRDFPDVGTALHAAELQMFKWYEVYATRTPPFVSWLVKVADRIEQLSYLRQWGYGAVSDTVMREWQISLWDDTIPKAAAGMGVVLTDLKSAAKHILDHSTQEFNSVQMRRYR